MGQGAVEADRDPDAGRRHRHDSQPARPLRSLADPAHDRLVHRPHQAPSIPAAPAISAGVLPIVLGITSWLYPLCILGSLSVLTVILLLWRTTAPGEALSAVHGHEQHAVDVLESAPRWNLFFIRLFLFVAAMGVAAQWSGWRFLLFPPLIVMAYEMLGHPRTCAWAMAPYTFPVVCTLAAACGVGAERWLGVTPVATSGVLIVTFVLLRLVKLRVPPALAVGLIPFVIPSPTLRYAASVAIGTSALTLWLLLYRRGFHWVRPEPITQPSCARRLASWIAFGPNAGAHQTRRILIEMIPLLANSRSALAPALWAGSVN